MKYLQNNFTTPDQSKRLLELGVPVDSADCGIVEDIMHGGREILTVPYSKWCKGYEDISFPCWSVGRLIEIYMIAAGLQWIDLCLPDDFTESIVKMFEGTKDLDFSKLED